MNKAVGRLSQKPQFIDMALQFCIGFFLFQFQASRFDHPFDRRAQPLQIVL